MRKVIKKFKILIFILIFVIIGVIVSLFYHQNIFFKIKSGLLLTPWWVYISFLILSFYVTLVIHEMTHFVVFKIYKIKIRAVFITIIEFFKNDKGFKIKINLGLFKFFGGMVIPRITNINSDQEYSKVRKGFTNSLIAAPVVTIVFAVLLSIRVLFILFLSTNFLSISLNLIATVFVILFSVFYTLSSMVKTELAIGDFKAYQMNKKDDLFALAEIVSYSQFEAEIDFAMRVYLHNKTVELLKNERNIYNQFYLSLVQFYLENIVFYNIGEDLEINGKLNEYNLRLLLHQENQREVLALLSCFYFINRNNKSLTIYEVLSSSAKSAVDNYQLKKIAYLLGLDNDYSYFENPLNIVYSALDFLFKDIYDYKKQELKTLKPLVKKAEEDCFDNNMSNS